MSEYITSIGGARPVQPKIQRPRPLVWKRLCPTHWLDYRIDEKGCKKCLEGGEK